ncbi:helix-turn-helix domain-containing protein [Nioella sp.]|uniref:helix-turn-helix domain-containing protein n=1 Tax=Nioella sp. TaxID=1912091 RepID=UPI003515B4BC
MSNWPRPPAHVEPYVRILGHEGAVAFILEFGGSEVYFPMKPAVAARAPAAALIGAESVMALGMAGVPRRVPTAKPWLARVFRTEGLRVPEIARKLHATDVSVRKWLKDEVGQRWGDDRQMRLF